VLIVPEATVLDQDGVQIGGPNVLGIIINIVIPDARTTAIILLPHTNPNVGSTLTLLMFVYISIDLRGCPQSSVGTRLKLVAVRFLVVFGAVLGDFAIGVNTGLFALCEDVLSSTTSNELEPSVVGDGRGDGTDDTGTKSEKSGEACEEIHCGWFQWLKSR